jgi:hypothetical protein
LAEFLDLLARTVNHNDIDAQRTQDTDIEDQIPEITVRDDFAVNAQDKNLVTELGRVG